MLSIARREPSPMSIRVPVAKHSSRTVVSNAPSSSGENFCRASVFAIATVTGLSSQSRLAPWIVPT